MGIDYLTCKVCGDTFNDCGDYVTCECGNNWCGDDCAKKDGLERSYDDDRCEMSCNFCRKEDFEDYDLLNHALKLLNISRQDLVNKYKEKWVSK